MCEGVSFVLAGIMIQIFITTGIRFNHINAAILVIMYMVFAAPIFQGPRFRYTD
jgi:hypothetical protein